MSEQDFEVAEIDGKKYQIVPASMFPGIADRLPENTDKLLLPVIERDDRLRFPHELAGEPNFESFAFVSATSRTIYAAAGLTAHTATQKPYGRTKDPKESSGFRALELELFREDDWFEECFLVLCEHQWTENNGDISERVIQRVIQL